MNLLNKIKEIIKLEKVETHTSEYPTKAEYEKQVKDIQSKELKSDRFKKIHSFIVKHDMRINLGLEEKLFSLVGTYGLEDNLFNKKYDEINANRLSRFDELVSFIDSLSREQIDSNIYLKSAEFFIKASIYDCGEIAKIIREEIDDKSSNKRIEIDYEIPGVTLKFLPTRISEQVGIPFYEPRVYKTDYVDLLDENHQHIYTNYNKYVSKIDKLATDIYHLRLWNLLSNHEEQIDSYYFHILNNSFEHKILISCFIKNKEKVFKNTKKEEKVIPFEEIAEELDRYLDEFIGPKEEIEDSIYGEEIDKILSLKK